MNLILKRICFYILSFTWGIIMSFIGLILLLVLLPMKRVHVFHGRLYGVIGKNWGGIALGCFFFVDDRTSTNTKAHEAGHGLQNAVLGPLFPFVVAIPSAIRYWYRELKYSRKHITPPTAYDDIWFEGQATRLGKAYVLTDKI